MTKNCLETFAYDNNGNLTNWVNGNASWSYQWDWADRLTNVTSNSVVLLQNWYDALGRRVAKNESVNGQSNYTVYLWDGLDLVAVLNSSGQVSETFTRGVELVGDIGSLVAVTHHAGSVTNGTFYIHSNHRGDVVLSRSGTATVGTCEYGAFGSLRSKTGAAVCRFAFSSQETDTSTGFSYYAYRFYAPTWQRWLSRDPLGEEIDINLHRFVGNMPLNHVDPHGLWGFPVRFPSPILFPINLFPPCSGPRGGKADKQDNKCSIPGGDYLGNCFQQCCKSHDDCFAANGCNWLSWIPGCGSFSCKMCDVKVVACFIGAAVKQAAGKCNDCGK